MAALLAGDVDLIENVPSSSLNVLRKNQNFRLESASGNRVLYLALDHDREVSPFAAGPDGKNPLRDRKVRQAMSMAIARDALIARIMDGQGVPAGQLVPQGFFGWVPGLEAPKADMSAAKKLLAEAGYPDGFTLTYHATNDRYPNDEKVAQAIGQMFSKIGIKVSVVTLPGNVYFSRASAREFSIVMGGAAAETGEAASVLGPCSPRSIRKKDRDRAIGAAIPIPSLTVCTARLWSTWTTPSAKNCFRTPPAWQWKMWASSPYSSSPTTGPCARISPSPPAPTAILSPSTFHKNNTVLF